MRRLILGLALGLSLALAAPARADQAARERAQAAFNAGAQAYERGNYLAAIQAFEEAHRASSRPGLLFSLGQAHRRQYYVDRDDAHLRAAVDNYRAYLAKVASGPRRADAAQALVELEPLAAKLGAAAAAAPVAAKPRTRLMVSSSVDGAEVSLDGRAPQPSPLIEDVAPGTHRVQIHADGYFHDARQVTAVEGGLVALDVPLRERPAFVTIRTEAGADVIVDRRPVGRAPLAGAIELPAGRHFVAVVRNGRRPHGEEIAVTRGQSRTLEIELAASPQRTATFALAAGAAGAAVASGVFTGLAFAKQASAQATYDASRRGPIEQADLDAYGAAVSSRDDWRRAAGGAFGSALLLGLTSIGLLLFDTPRPPPAPARDEGPKGPARTLLPMEVSAVPALGPGLVGGGVLVRF